MNAVEHTEEQSRRNVGGVIGHVASGAFSLLIALVFSPPTALNRELLRWGKRPKPGEGEAPLRWIQVNPIIGAWTGALLATVLLVLHRLGGDEAILGWLAVLTGVYVLVVMGFNPRLIGGIVIVLFALVLSLLVALILKGQSRDFWLVKGFLRLVFDTGMKFYPFPTAVLAGAAALLVVADGLFQLVWYRNFVDANHFNMYSASGPRKTLPRDEYTPQDDITDVIEFFSVRVGSIVFEPKDAGKPSVVQERVPYARHIADELKRRASVTNVSMRPE
jgi:hypothetical protein